MKAGRASKGKDRSKQRAIQRQIGSARPKQTHVDNQSNVAAHDALDREVTKYQLVEDALQRDVDRLDRAERHAQLGSWEFDVTTGQSWWSKQMYRMFGFEPSADVPSAAVFLERIHPQDRLSLYAALVDIMQGHVPQIQEFRSNPTWDPVRYFAPTIECVTDSYGKPIRFIGALLDITARKQAEDALHEAADKRIAIFSAIGDSITIANMQGQILEANDHAVRLHGFENKQEFLDTNLIQLVSEADRDRMIRDGFAIMQSGSTGIFEYVLCRKDGSLFDGELRLARLSDPQQGQATIIAITRDISARKQMEARLRHFYDLPLVGMAVISADRCFVQVNAKLCDMLGYSEAELIGMSWVPITHPDDIAENVRLLEETLAGRIEGYTMDKRFIRKDGAIMFASISVRPMRQANGGMDHLVLVIQDITARKQAEEALRVSERTLQLFIAYAPTSIAMFSRDMTYIAASRRYITDYHLEDMPLIGRSHYEIFPDIPERWKEIHRSCLAGAIEKAEVDPFPRADGTLDWVQWEIRPWYEKPGEIGGIVLFSEVITALKQSERALRESEQRFRALVEGSMQGILVHRNHQPLFANQAYAQILGYDSPDDIISKDSVLPFIAPDDQERLQSYHAARIKGEPAPNRYDFHIIRRDGTRLTLQQIVTTILWDGLPAVLATMTDITKQKHAEDALIRSHERFELIGKAANDAMWEWNYETNEGWANRAHQELFGLTLADFVPDEHEWKRRIYPEDQERIYQSFQEARVSTDTFWNAEYRFQTENKGWMSVYDRTYLERNEAGHVVRMIGSLMDITQRKQTEEALANERNLLRTLIDNLPDAIYVKDINGRFLLTNRAGTHTMGAATSDEAVGKSDFDYHAPELAAKYYADDQALIHSGQAIINQEGMILHANGRLGWMSTTKVPLRDQQGQIIGLVGIGHDITAQKQANEEKAKLEAQLYQAQKIESVGRLAGGVAHDFNNMLGVILGHTELALDEIDPTLPVYNDLKEIRKAALRSANLTRQLLAFARKQIIVPKILHLNETVAGVITMLQRMIGENIDLVWIPGDALWTVKIDPTQIDQILANLCVNARDAITDVGQITIATRNYIGHPSDWNNDSNNTFGYYVVLSVSDNGSGMDEMTQAHLFEPFFTTKPLGHGTGLGLATVYGIVKQNNGFISFSSELGRGTTFQICLPCHIATQSPVLDDQATLPIQGSGETILLVEDEPAILNLGSTMLTRLGYHVLTASTPRAALAIAETYVGTLHLLMTDVIMPDMNGYDLARQLQVRHPYVKCLFMSGYTADIIARNDVLEDGVFFIQKPFSMKELAAKVREVVG